MTKKIERIGVLTGGGDCPGINAVLRAVTKTAIYRYGVRVFGIEDGFQGLIENRVGELFSLHVSGILTRGGTILGTNNKCNPQRVHVGDDGNGQPIFRDMTNKCLETIERHKLDALIVIGGDGTMSAASSLLEAGINCIGVPKTIDNDIVGTEITFGFLTASETATNNLDRLHSTAASHHRVMVCEVMGRNAGWLALHSGVASGSDVILIPEIPFDIEKVCDFVRSRTDRSRGFSIVCIAEGARTAKGEQVVARRDETSPDPVRLGGVGKVVADQIQDRTGIETRTTVLGHILRGGSPIGADRVLASQFGHHAITRLMDGAKARMVAMQGGTITDLDINTAVNKQRLVPHDDPLIDIARSVRTCFGD